MEVVNRVKIEYMLSFAIYESACQKVYLHNLVKNSFKPWGWGINQIDANVNTTIMRSISFYRGTEASKLYSQLSLNNERTIYKYYLYPNKRETKIEQNTNHAKLHRIWQVLPLVMQHPASLHRFVDAHIRHLYVRH